MCRCFYLFTCSLFDMFLFLVVVAHALLLCFFQPELQLDSRPINDLIVSGKLVDLHAYRHVPFLSVYLSISISVYLSLPSFTLLAAWDLLIKQHKQHRIPISLVELYLQHKIRGTYSLLNSHLQHKITIGFLLVYCVEALLNIMAYGLILPNKSFLRRPEFILDLLIIVFG